MAGAPEGWPTMAVVATCRPLIGPDGLAASSLPFLMRERPPPVDCYGLVPTAAALNTSRSCASHTLSLWMLAHPAARRGATPVAVPHRGSGGNRVRPYQQTTQGVCCARPTIVDHAREQRKQASLKYCF